MQSAFDVIKKYFKAAASNPDASGIAPATTLATLLPAFVTALVALKIVPLTPAERTAMQGKDPQTQRLVARALLKLAQRRPALATAAALDPATFDTIIQKDEAFDLLAQTMQQIAQILDDGLLLLQAGSTQTVVTVLSYVRSFVQSNDAAPDAVRHVQVSFNAVDLNTQTFNQKKIDKQQRQQRQQRAGQQAVTQGQQTLAAQPAVDAFIKEARKGA